MSLKRPFVPKGDVKQRFTTSTHPEHSTLNNRYLGLGIRIIFGQFLIQRNTGYFPIYPIIAGLGVHVISYIV